MNSPHLSRSVEFDDERYFRFTRQTHLPISTFAEPKRITGWIVGVVCAVAAVVAYLLPHAR